MLQFDVFLPLFMNLVLLSFSLMLVLGFLSVSIISLRSEKVKIRLRFFDTAAVLLALWTRASKELNILTVGMLLLITCLFNYAGTLRRFGRWCSRPKCILRGPQGIWYVTRINIFHYYCCNFNSVHAKVSIAMYCFRLVGYHLCLAQLLRHMCLAFWSVWYRQAIGTAFKGKDVQLLGLHDGR